MAFVADGDLSLTHEFDDGEGGVVTVVHERDAAGNGHRLVVDGDEGDPVAFDKIASHGDYRGVSRVAVNKLHLPLPRIFKIVEGDEAE